MGTKTYNNYEDLLTFTRASEGYALRPVSYGTELVTNGTFDSDLSGWTTGGNVTSAYSSGTAQLTLGGALTSTSGNWFSQTVFEVGKIYFVTFDATYVSGGSLQAGYGFDLEVTATSSGTYSFTVDPAVGLGTQTNRNNITFGGTSGAVWKIDNISVKEVTFDESDGTLTLFEHPTGVPRVEWVVNTEKTKFKNISSQILKAAAGIEPQATEFDVLVNGQKIGDITNNGDVSAFDASMYISWFEGSLTNQTYIEYIEDVLNPYLEANLSKYLADAPVGRQRAGLLVEEQRTNLVTSSDATGWTVAVASATNNTETTLGAFTGAVVSSNGADWHRHRPANITVASGTTYVVTLFYEYGTSGNVLLNFRNGVGATESRITGAWGSLATPYQNAGTLTILEKTALPQNVKKVVARFVPNFSGNFEIGIGPNSNTSGETVIAYAAQCEQASFGTSYIKTTGSTATRSVDVATLSFDNFGHNKKEMTLLVDFDYRGWQYISQYPRAVGLGRTTSSTNANFGIFNDGNNPGTLRYRVDNSSGAAVLGAANLSGSDEVTSAKVALAIKEGQHAITYNGNTPISSTGGDPELETVDILAIGAIWTEATQQPSGYMNGHIKSIKYYPRRLTNAQLQDITS